MNTIQIKTKADGTQYLQIIKVTGSFYGKHHPKTEILLEQKLEDGADLNKIYDNARKGGLLWESKHK